MTTLVEKTCPVCCATFTSPVSGQYQKKFCSDRCRWRGHESDRLKYNAVQRERYREAVGQSGAPFLPRCPNCRKAFTPQPEFAERLFCSFPCYLDWWSKEKVRLAARDRAQLALRASERRESAEDEADRLDREILARRHPRVAYCSACGMRPALYGLTCGRQACRDRMGATG